MASSDIHFGRPGTGYKEFIRAGHTESTIVQTKRLAAYMPGPSPEPIAKSVPLDPINTKIHRLFFIEAERQMNFFTTGGLIAAHSKGRNRKAIWNAMQAKEVYGTSGERILLWFELENGPEGKVPMGSTVGMKRNPRFVVRAVGSFKTEGGLPRLQHEGYGKR